MKRNNEWKSMIIVMKKPKEYREQDTKEIKKVK